MTTHGTHSNPNIRAALRREFSDWKLWASRVLVLAFAAMAGLTIVGFTWLSERAMATFDRIEAGAWWLPLLWMPASTAVIVWLMLRLAPGATGSGIPQVIAALTPSVPARDVGLFVSLKLALAKLLLTTCGLLSGLTLGREGPAVQIAAGVMHSARRWLPARTQITEQGLLMAGGAAGIAAAFNTPLGGVMFAIEELSRRPEQRSSGLIVAAIVLGGLMSVSAYGNSTYFGVIHADDPDLDMLLPGVLVALACGIAGGLFSRLLLVSLGGRAQDRLSCLRRRSPVRFAAACGLALAIIGIATHGATYGSGYAYTQGMLSGEGEASLPLTVLRFLATWITAWSGVPGGIFAPSLSIGASIGNDVASFFGSANSAMLIALGMAGFLAAVTQAPLTAFIIVMEMVDGHALVLSLMASALVASGVSRLISAPLYGALAQMQLARLPQPPETASTEPEAKPPA